ncbi:MAG: response regulator transcription factor [Bacteroidetes bacterium]|nr:response regulator transcription factor [Bacteroidota bacterium]
MKILVCEDDFMIVKAIEHKLKNEGYEVETAKDGREASEKIKNNIYDLILTDLLMPFLGGIELINLVRTQLKKDTPIIVLSRLGNEDSILEAFKLGADDYITKPFSPNELSIRVKKLLIKR